MSGSGFNESFGDRYLLDLELEEIIKSKKKKNFIEELFEPEKIEVEKRSAEEISAFIDNRLKDLKSTINQINKEIYLRFDMKKKFEEELDYQITKAAFSLSQFKFWGLGYNTGVDVKRNMLERQLADFRKEKRRTELQCWEDIISLRKELRKAQEEYKTILSRKNNLG